MASFFQQVADRSATWKAALAPELDEAPKQVSFPSTLEDERYQPPRPCLIGPILITKCPEQQDFFIADTQPQGQTEPLGDHDLLAMNAFSRSPVKKSLVVHLRGKSSSFLSHEFKSFSALSVWNLICTPTRLLVGRITLLIKQS